MEILKYSTKIFILQMYISFKYQSSVSFRAEYPFKGITIPVENCNKPPLICLKHSVQLHHREKNTLVIFFWIWIQKVTECRNHLTGDISILHYFSQCYKVIEYQLPIIGIDSERKHIGRSLVCKMRQLSFCEVNKLLRLQLKIVFH